MSRTKRHSAIPFSNQRSSMKRPLTWTKLWNKWFSSCNSDHRRIQENGFSMTDERHKRIRTKSENDLSKRNSVDQEEEKKNFTHSPTPIEASRKSFSHHHQTKEKVNNSNPVLYRANSRRYSNPFFPSVRHPSARLSIAALPTANNSNNNNNNNSVTLRPTTRPSINLSRSVDRLAQKSQRRELRYEEHDDFIPSPLYSIQCYPTIDDDAKNLNQSGFLSSTDRRHQRPYSTNIPYSSSSFILGYFSNMSRTTSEKNPSDNYGKLSECHSLFTPVENASVKAPRPIESTYGQFPTNNNEPLYANTQSLYDNILYPTQSNEMKKRSCASQTQLTWTMATFSSFVDLENQTIIIPQPDPTTLYSIVQHHQPYPAPSASTELCFAPENPSSHYQRPRTPTEKRDGSFQTTLSIGPHDDLETNRQLFVHDPSLSPPVPTSQHQHRHHHHRKHRSRSHHNPSSISTRDVGLQVNIQTVKKIILSPTTESADSSSIGTISTPPKQLKSVQTNTDGMLNTEDRATSIDFDQSTSSTTSTDRAAQTTNKTLRDQAIETNHRGLFVCDLSSLLANGAELNSSVLFNKPNT